MKIGLKLLIISMICFSLISCGDLVPVTFKPSVFSHDYKNEQILYRDIKSVACRSPEFNNYGSIHIDELKELAKILRKAKIPKSHVYILKDLEQSIKEINKSKED